MTLIGWWPLHDDSAQDYSGNGNHGTLNSGVTTGVAGKAGLQGMSFDGNDDYISIGDLGIGVPSELTITQWVYPTDLSGSHHSAFTGNGDDDFYFRSLSDGKFEFGLRDGGGNFVGIQTEDAISKHQWYLMTGKWDGENMYLYKNGNLEASTSITSIQPPFHQFYIGLGYSASNRWHGKIADTRIYNHALSPLEIQTLYEQGAKAAPPTDGTARYEFEDDVTDSWGSNDGTNNGASFVDGKKGQAASFNGSSDWVDISKSFSNQFGTSNFSVTGWFKTSSSGRIIDNRDESNGYVGFVVGLNGSGQLRLTIDDGSTSESRYKTDKSFNDDKWHYFVAQRVNGDSQGMNIYVDGAKQSLTADFSTTIDSNYDISHNQPTQIGAQYVESNSSYSGHFNGQIDDLRIYPYALSSQQVSALYHGWSDLARPTTDGLVAHYKLDGDATDSAGSNDGTNNGASWTRGVRGQAGEFQSGNNDHVDIGDFSVSSSMAISAWVKPDQLSSIISTIVGGGYDGSTYPYLFYIRDTGIFQFQSYDGSGHVVTSSSTAQTGVWYHVVGQYDNSTNEYTIWVNGAKESTVSDTVGPSDADNSLNDWIGAQQDSGSVRYPFDGKIDDVRIYDRALEPWEIHELYRWGTRGRDLRPDLVRKRG